MNKIISAVLLLGLISLAGCAGSMATGETYNQVRYTKGIIHSVDRDIVTLSDGSVWKTNRILTAVNMSPVMLVIRETLDEGFLYVDGFKYRLFMQMPDVERISFYNIGFLDLVQNLDKKKAVITLFSNSKFYVRPEDIPKIEEWGAGPEVIISSERTFLINPRTLESVPVIEIPPLSNADN